MPVCSYSVHSIRTRSRLAYVDGAAMTFRPLLYVAATPSAPPLPDRVGSEWTVRLARDLRLAREDVESGRYRVGLVAIEGADPKRLMQLEHVLSGSTQMEWIALLPAEPACHLRQFVSRNCYDYHRTPVQEQRLLIILGHAFGMAEMRSAAGVERDGEDSSNLQMVGASGPMQKVFRAIRKIANVDAPVLIVGESGTGKELAARAIHERSQRAHGPFVPVNCGALPSTLIHSELFGHEKGAFTDACSRKIGRIEAASGGTIFLDEIGDLPRDMQVSLLRFLQEKTIERLGSTRTVTVDARVVAATHVDLDEAVADGRFREDLYYRLNVLRLPIPPLRDRPGDIELLARFFFHEFVGESQNRVTGFSQEAVECMLRHRWSGNVRELINRVRRALVMSEGRLISAVDLGLEQRACSRPVHTLEKARALADVQAVQDALFRNNSNVTRAAEDLGVSRITLYRLMEKYNISGALEARRQRTVSQT